VHGHVVRQTSKNKHLASISRMEIACSLHVHFTYHITQPNTPQDCSTETAVLLKLNIVALVRDRTIPTEQPVLVSEVSENFCG
jgi:hypothetical protein